MATDYYDIMHPGLEQFAYLKCPSKIRAAIINAGGPRYSVDSIARKLSAQPRRNIRSDVGEPTDADAEIFVARGFNVAAIAPAPRRKPKLVLTDQERARIAAIAALIPDRVLEKPKRVMRKRLDPTAANFPDQVIRFVLRRAGMNRASLFQVRRRGVSKGAAALIAVILREVDAKRFSYPKLARILRKKDHTTIIHAVEQWPVYAEQWPELDVIYAEAVADLAGRGE